MKKLLFFCCLFFFTGILYAQQEASADSIDKHAFDPAKLIWFNAPAKLWTEAIPIGNGRLGGMIFGGPTEERIQLNEDTYWTGGPYSTVVKGGYKYLPQVRDLVFKGKFKEAQALFGRELMGYPVEQQKYQSLANLMLFFTGLHDISNYKRWLDLKSGLACVEFNSDGVIYKREVLSSFPNQVIAMRLTASKPGSIFIYS